MVHALQCVSTVMYCTAHTGRECARKASRKSPHIIEQSRSMLLFEDGLLECRAKVRYFLLHRSEYRCRHTRGRGLYGVERIGRLKHAVGIDDSAGEVYAKGEFRQVHKGWTSRGEEFFWDKPAINSGDKVKIECDLRVGRNCITFYKNGQRMGPGNKDYTFTLDNNSEEDGKGSGDNSSSNVEALRWYPAVSLKKTGSWCAASFW